VLRPVTRQYPYPQGVPPLGKRMFISIDATLPALTASAHISVPNVSIAATLPKLTGAARFGGHITATLPALQVSARFGSQISATLPALTGAIEISGELPIRINATLPDLQGLLTALSGDVIEVAVELPALQASASFGSRITATLPGLVADVSFVDSRSVRVSGTLPALEGLLSISGGNSIRIDATLPSLVAGPYFDVRATLPALTARAKLSLQEAATYSAYVMNLATHAVTPYGDFPFTQIVRWQDKHILVGPDGLYEWTGVTDSDEPIDAVLHLLANDWEATKQQRIVEILLHSRLTETLHVTQFADERPAVAYQKTPIGTGAIKVARVKTGQGVVARNHGFAIESDGKLDIHGITLRRQQLGREI